MFLGAFNYIPLLTERINQETEAINILLLWSKDLAPTEDDFSTKPG
jgi:hypothetical protein